MLKICLAAALSLAAASSVCAHETEHPVLRASGDGTAHLTLRPLGNEKFAHTIGINATFTADLPVQDSTEAHSKSRWFTGEIRVGGKPCSDARARIRANQAAIGRAIGQASTTCTAEIAPGHPVVVEASVDKAEGLERDDVHIDLAVEQDVYVLHN